MLLWHEGLFDCIIGDCIGDDKEEDCGCDGGDKGGEGASGVTSLSSTSPSAPTAVEVGVDGDDDKLVL